MWVQPNIFPENNLRENFRKIRHSVISVCDCKKIKLKKNPKYNIILPHLKCISRPQIVTAVSAKNALTICFNWDKINIFIITINVKLTNKQKKGRDFIYRNYSLDFPRSSFQYIQLNNLFVMLAWIILHKYQIISHPNTHLLPSHLPFFFCFVRQLIHLIRFIIEVLCTAMIISTVLIIILCLSI